MSIKTDHEKIEDKRQKRVAGILKIKKRYGVSEFTAAAVYDTALPRIEEAKKEAKERAKARTLEAGGTKDDAKAAGRSAAKAVQKEVYISTAFYNIAAARRKAKLEAALDRGDKTAPAGGPVVARRDHNWRSWGHDM